MKKGRLDVKNQEHREKDTPQLPAGQAFVKMIGPFGSILFLLVFVLFLIFCFTGGGIK